MYIIPLSVPIFKSIGGFCGAFFTLHWRKVLGFYHPVYLRRFYLPFTTMWGDAGGDLPFIVALACYSVSTILGVVFPRVWG